MDELGWNSFGGNYFLGDSIFLGHFLCFSVVSGFVSVYIEGSWCFLAFSFLLLRFGNYSNLGFD
jgi:hypothetical protein